MTFDYDAAERAAWEAYCRSLPADHVDYMAPDTSGEAGEPGPDDALTLPPDLDELLASTDPDYVWLIPGLVERGDRVLLTGNEGKGKSTFNRQFGTQVASGVHPFTLEPIEPVRVLVLDTENSERQVRRAVRGLRDAAGADYRPGGIRFLIRPRGVDLTRSRDRDGLRRYIDAVEPQLLIAGPLYKLASGDATEQTHADQLTGYFDHLRAEYDLTLLLETHQPYSETHKATDRALRPFGSSVWSRWPEFGIHLADDGTLTHWRGARDERQWPTKLKRGSPWPWMVDATATPAGTDRHVECVEAIIDVLASVAPTELSFNQLRGMVRDTHPGRFGNAGIESAINRAVMDGLVTMHEGPRKAHYHGLPTEHDSSLDF